MLAYLEKMILYIDYIKDHCQKINVIHAIRDDLIDDPKDKQFIELALSSNAKYLVTGDKDHLLPLKHYQGIQIVSPYDFMQREQIASDKPF